MTSASRVLRPTIAALGTFVMVASASATEKPYQQPVAAIPYAHGKPTIDGVVDDAEWQGGFSQQALQTTTFDVNARKISGRQSRFWVMWDEDNLDVAMRSPPRAGERPLQVLKGLGNDQDDVIRDDAYEICISMGASDPQSDLKNGTIQYIGTVTGAHLDGWLETPIGERRVGRHFPYSHAKSRVYRYDSGWASKSRIAAANEWEMEVAIPRASEEGCLKAFHPVDRCAIGKLTAGVDHGIVPTNPPLVDSLGRREQPAHEPRISRETLVEVPLAGLSFGFYLRRKSIICELDS